MLKTRRKALGLTVEQVTKMVIELLSVWMPGTEFGPLSITELENDDAFPAPFTREAYLAVLSDEENK